MGRKRGGDRATGPYWRADRQQWRFRVWIGGVPSWQTCRPGTTEAEARAEVAGWNAEFGNTLERLSVEEAADAWRDHVINSGRSEQTAAFERQALNVLVELFADKEPEALTARHLSAYINKLAYRTWTTRKGAKAHKPRSLHTQRDYWLSLKRAWKWWKKRGLVYADVPGDLEAMRDKLDEPLPWNTVTARRTMEVGKEQLNTTELASAYLSAALAQPTPQTRCGAALPLLTGLSSGELRHIVARRVDFDRMLIRMDDIGTNWRKKTKARRRSVELPNVLVEDLKILCQRSGYIFRNPTTGEPRSRTWLLKLVRRVCKQAGVPYVTPHGLRGSYSSLREEVMGDGAARIAQALGHGDGGKTAREHYIRIEKAPALKVVS